MVSWLRSPHSARKVSVNDLTKMVDTKLTTVQAELLHPVWSRRRSTYLSATPPASSSLYLPLSKPALVRLTSACASSYPSWLSLGDM